jgi:hypothetical protein
MPSITKQPTSVKSLVDIYNLNKSYLPTKDTLVLLSTINGTSVVGKVGDLLKSPKIFNKSLINIYCPEGLEKTYKDLIPLRG